MFHLAASFHSLYSDYVRLITNKDQLKIIEDFVVDLEQTLGVTIRVVSCQSLWHRSPPSEVGGESLEEYMKDVSP